MLGGVRGDGAQVQRQLRRHAGAGCPRLMGSKETHPLVSVLGRGD